MAGFEIFSGQDGTITVRHVPVLSSSIQVVDSARDLGVVIDSHLAVTSLPYAAPSTFICDNYT